MTGEPEVGSPQSGEFDERWRKLLSGDPSALPGLSRWFRRLPSPPRCKSCGVPFAGPYVPLLKALGFRPWPVNEQLCRWCYHGLAKRRGGAEVPVSLLYTDVRDSTVLAEHTTPTRFRYLLDRFFTTVFASVDAEGGVIDHIVGDGVMAMWTPGFGGPDHSKRAIAAGRRLIRALASDSDTSESVQAGVGVHTGEAWVGVVGEPGAHDFTVLGDVPNTTARLGSAVGGGELAISVLIAEVAGVDTSGLELRVLHVKGKTYPVNVWVERGTAAFTEGKPVSET
jgi:adenylate cyclase